uniref:Uncharacterized protein n=1 Tax=Arundo donax TaxID=35708 RepID=A0A0A9BY32_ARUDO
MLYRGRGSFFIQFLGKLKKLTMQLLNQH